MGGGRTAIRTGGVLQYFLDTLYGLGVLKQCPTTSPTFCTASEADKAIHPICRLELHRPKHKHAHIQPDGSKQNAEPKHKQNHTHIMCSAFVCVEECFLVQKKPGNHPKFKKNAFGVKMPFSEFSESSGVPLTQKLKRNETI